jgi:Glycosyl transferases group 1
MTAARRLLLVTDNRFWLQQLGSNARILSVVQHLRAQGWALQVAFCGHGYPSDLAAIGPLGLEVRFSLPQRPQPAAVATSPTGPAAAEKPNLRALLQQARRWLRAAATQYRRPHTPIGWRREVALRAQAPRVSDLIDTRHAALVQAMCRSFAPQVALVEFVRLAWLAPLLPRGVLRVLDTHDVQHERQQRFHAAGEAHGLDISAEEEARWLAGFNVLVAIQRVDAAKLATLAPAVRVVTAMHPLALRRAAPLPERVATVGFLGSDMAPNVRAAQELLREIWPRVQAGLGGRAQLRIAGTVCRALVGEPLPAGVELLGFTADIDRLYDGLAVLVNPVRMGGGLKIKNVEALCQGRPLITTTLGAEGLEDGIASAFVVADDARSCAEQLLTLLQDPARREALSDQAHAYARCHFDVKAVYAELDAALAGAAATSSLAGSD